MLVPVAAMPKLSICLLQGATVTHVAQAFVLSGAGTGTAGNACELREANKSADGWRPPPIGQATCIAAATLAFGSNSQLPIACSSTKELGVDSSYCCVTQQQSVTCMRQDVSYW